MYEQIIIGGGASALMFGAFIEDKNKTLIVEHNPNLGAKILISGGGKCNFTNKIITPKAYLAQEQFLIPILKSFDNNRVKEFFTSRGLEIDIKNNTQYFCKNSAKDLLDILTREIKGVNLALEHKVLEVKKEKDIFIVVTNKREFRAKRVVVASGGLSYPKVGATDIGFKIAKDFGINVISLKPALVGFTLQKEQHFFKELSGVSLFARVEVNSRVFEDNILFAHRGITGPAILNASLFWEKGEIKLNFLPNFDLKAISSNKSISNTLPLPKRFTKIFLQHIGLEDKIFSKLTPNERTKLHLLQNYTFAPAGTFGFSKAEVTKGGVDIKEIEASSLMSKKIKNLFFIGEVLDIAGIVGGFNFQFAFSSAVFCANWINKSKVSIK